MTHMLLQPAFKQPKKVNVNAALHESIALSRGEEPAAMVVSACREFQRLRSAASEPPTTETTREGLLKYYRALIKVLDDCKVLGDKMTTSCTTTSSSSIWRLPLLWTSSLSSEMFCEIPDLRLDVLCVLFNLGVNEASLGTQAFVQGNDWYKVAAKRFQIAAGFFDFAANRPTPGGFNSVTSDIYPTTLTGLRDMMLGNAQSVFLELCKVNGTNTALQARLAAGAREFYTLAFHSFNVSVSGQSDPRVMGMFGKPCQAMAAYFNVLSLSNAALAANEAGQIAVEIVRLRGASEALQAAIVVFNEVPRDSGETSIGKTINELDIALENLEIDLPKRLSNAEEENRKFYFESLPEKLAEVAPHQSVKVASVAGLLMNAPVDVQLAPFEELGPLQDDGEGDSVPPGSVASRYLAVANAFVADIVAKTVSCSSNARAALDDVEQTTKRAREAISNMDNATSTASPSSGRVGSGNELSKEEKRVIDAIRLVRTEGGEQSLRTRQMQVVAYAKKAMNQVDTIQKLLRDEEEQDSKLRMYAPGRRPNSLQLTSEFQSTLGRVRTNLEQAANADKLIAHELDEYAQPINAISQVDVEAAINARLGSSNRRCQDQPENNVDITADQLTQLTSEINTLFAQKDKAVQAIEATRRKENPSAVTASMSDENGSGVDAEAEAFDHLVHQRYGELENEIYTICEELNSRTNAVLAQLKRLRELTDNANRAITEVDEGMRGMLGLFKHEAAALKFGECLDHLQQGMAFYVKESENVKTLYNEVSKFCLARNEEFKRIMNESQNGSGGPRGYMGNVTSFYPTGGSAGGADRYQAYPNQSQGGWKYRN